MSTKMHTLGNQKAHMHERSHTPEFLGILIFTNKIKQSVAVIASAEPY
jgi:hypothetical protein